MRIGSSAGVRRMRSNRSGWIRASGTVARAAISRLRRAATSTGWPASSKAAPISSPERRAAFTWVTTIPRVRNVR